MADNAKPWAKPMPDAQFKLMHDILAAPSPIGLEGAMTHGVLKPYFESIAPSGWSVQAFRGHAGVVLDTHPGRNDLFTVMVIGHADKIRMQVRSVGEDGKVWINSDSFLPTTLIGHEVSVFSEDPNAPGAYRRLDGGTVEALGAIHFADPKLRSGDKGVRKEQLYLELQIHGKDKKKQIEALGIRPGDSILMNRPIRRGFGPDSFYGAYLDNGLGCFVAAEAARLVAESGGANNIRMLFAAATYEEIGRFGSRVLASEMRPDAIIGVDVNHDFVAAPGIGDKRMSPVEMGKGFTMSVGSIVSEQLNQRIETVARQQAIPMQRDAVGADTGTDGMAGVLGNVDCVATSVGMPIRNMHTISESACTDDVLACTHAVAETLKALDAEETQPGHLSNAFKAGHPRLDQAAALGHSGSGEPSA